ncbi:hypothetical protein Dimus_026976 [Dionaea muscipula]
MFRGATAILEDLKNYYPLNNAVDTVKEIGASIRHVMGGTSGVIYDIFFMAAYAELKASSDSEVTSKQSAIVAVSKYGGARAGYRTILDALIPAYTVLQEHMEAGDDPVDAFVLSSDAALAGAESTKAMQAQVIFLNLFPQIDSMDCKGNWESGQFIEASPMWGLASRRCGIRGIEEVRKWGSEMRWWAKEVSSQEGKAGRSTYVSMERLASVPDPGAMAAASWYRAAALAVKQSSQPSS